MRKGRLIPLSLMAISLGLVASIGMSVAWYANGAYLRISDIEVNLMTEPELGIALQSSDNAEDYYYGQFPYEELPKMKSGYSDTYDENNESLINGFVPVSSMFSGDWIGKTDENGELLEPQFCVNYKRPSIYEEDTFRKTDIAISGYYSILFYLYCDRDMYVSVHEDTTFTPNHEANVEKAKEILATSKEETRDLEQITSDLDKVVNSLRFSVYDCETTKYWIVDPYKTEETYLAGVLDLDKNSLFDFYYDSNDSQYKEYLFGEYDDEKGIIYRDVKEEIEPEVYDAFHAKHSTVTKEVDIESCIENGILKHEDSNTPSELSNVDMIAMKNGVPHKIILSFYIEGWDHDNTSLSSLGSFNTLFKFKLSKPNFSN